ncbi:guanylate-binding protein 2-like [Orbicella faveolata]|uniref:guanylate-binding protein 2-like n=1 Tax=Orbicella faveolata TaxID=48498 RepID=UPI0009E2FF92|nr:guanylate-binding protein 2-like [Orbicella faveolata]
MYRFIVNLSQQIQIRSHPESSSTYKDSAYFRKTFPCFFWLLRDVTLSIPKEYEDIRDYFLRKVFQEKVSSSTDQETTVVASILDFFPVFAAFDLPPPTVNKELLENINQKKSQLSPPFLRGLEQLKVKLDTILCPKRSFNDGEFVTGEALAALVSDYVAALNTPGAVPNVQSTWETYIQTKCSKVKAAAIKLYEGTMTSQLDGALPCDSEEIRRVHEMAMEESMREFETGTVQISAASCKNYLEELMEHMENDLKRWHEKNQRRTKEGCQELLQDLRKKHLDPILQRLTGPNGAAVSFDQIEGSFLAIERDFKKLARGARDVCAQEFYKFQPELQSEMEKHKAHLKQLKDYNEKLFQERKDRALREKEMQRILVKIHALYFA